MTRIAATARRACTEPRTSPKIDLPPPVFTLDGNSRRGDGDVAAGAQFSAPPIWPARMWPPPGTSEASPDVAHVDVAASGKGREVTCESREPECVRPSVSICGKRPTRRPGFLKSRCARSDVSALRVKRRLPRVYVVMSRVGVHFHAVARAGDLKLHPELGHPLSASLVRKRAVIHSGSGCFALREYE